MQHKVSILRTGVTLLIVLLLCTVVSAAIEQTMLPEVKVVLSEKPERQLPAMGRSSGSAAGQGKADGTLVEWVVPESAVPIFTAKNAELIFSSGGRLFTKEASLLPVGENTGGNTTLQAILDTKYPLPAGTAVGVLCIPPTPKTDESFSSSIALPESCMTIDERGYPAVFVIEEENGVWGKELRVHLETTKVLAASAGKVIISNRGEGAKYAAYPSRLLRDGERVREAGS